MSVIKKDKNQTELLQEIEDYTCEIEDTVDELKEARHRVTVQFVKSLIPKSLDGISWVQKDVARNDLDITITYLMGLKNGKTRKLTNGQHSKIIAEMKNIPEEMHYSFCCSGNKNKSKVTLLQNEELECPKCA